MKDTVTDHRKLEFGEEVNKEIDKESNLETGNRKQTERNMFHQHLAGERVTGGGAAAYQTDGGSDGEHHYPSHHLVPPGFLLDNDNNNDCSTLTPVYTLFYSNRLGTRKRKKNCGKST